MKPRAEAAGEPVDTQEILQLLPHRYPFLLVDGVTECVPNARITGVKNVTRNEPALSGDAPRGGFPHLLVVEALAQLAVILTFKSLGIARTGDELFFFAGIDNGRFLRVAKPGDQLVLRCELKRLRRGLGSYFGQALVDSEVAVEVEMLAAWKATA